jgi:uncharacterized protein YecE (DUF72 family)
MAEIVHVGCADLPHGVGWDRYFSKLGFVETTVLTRSNARPSVLAKWRAAAPGPGSFGVVAPEITSNPLGVARGLDQVATALKTLEAGALVFRTPPSFTPSAGNRELLKRLFSEVVTPEATGTAVRVWQPEGLWDTRTAVKLATEIGVVFGCDPLVRDQTRDPPDFFATLDVPDVYFRVTGLGRGGRRLASSQVDELVEITGAYERAWVVFATVDSLSDATRFQRLTGVSPTAGRDAEE